MKINLKYVVMQIFYVVTIAFLLFLLIQACQLLFPSITSSKNFQSSDAISIANTYIVYSTLIIVAMAFFLTIGGVIFTKWFSRQEAEIFKQNIDKVINHINNDPDIREAMLARIFEDRTLSLKINDKLDARLASMKNEIIEAVKPATSTEKHATHNNTETKQGWEKNIESGKK